MKCRVERSGCDAGCPGKRGHAVARREPGIAGDPGAGRFVEGPRGRRMQRLTAVVVQLFFATRTLGLSEQQVGLS